MPQGHLGVPVSLCEPFVGQLSESGKRPRRDSRRVVFAGFLAGRTALASGRRVITQSPDYAHSCEPSPSNARLTHIPARQSVLHSGASLKGCAADEEAKRTSCSLHSHSWVA